MFVKNGRGDKLYTEYMNVLNNEQKNSGNR